ncbi:hypothetical protein KC19_VG237200 [Ceratodon purpureus]|uniref:Uncharacterized protein n=1 Tax=Ceratodon purpureus TaxID=3225 RepID=A0A8T0HTL4_CERPU|nr:hypothetical protein KC19_VG237200 [Ceratodon purpureus]
MYHDNVPTEHLSCKSADLLIRLHIVIGASILQQICSTLNKPDDPSIHNDRRQHRVIACLRRRNFRHYCLVNVFITCMYLLVLIYLSKMSSLVVDIHIVVSCGHSVVQKYFTLW